MKSPLGQLSYAWSQTVRLGIQAPWLSPSAQYHLWQVPAACLILLVPFFFASCFSELLVVRGEYNNRFEPKVTRRAVIEGNVLSYAMLAALTAGWLVVYIVSPPGN